MLPRLQAEESLRLATAIALGSGTLKKSDAQAIRSDLVRQAEPARAGRPLTPSERLSAAESLGIRVVREEAS